MTSRKRITLAALGSALGIANLAFILHTSNFYPAGTSAFQAYCQEHQLKFGAYHSTRSGTYLGYSFMDYTLKPGTEAPVYHVLIPWIGAPKVTTLATTN